MTIQKRNQVLTYSDCFLAICSELSWCLNGSGATTARLPQRLSATTAHITNGSTFHNGSAKAIHISPIENVFLYILNYTTIYDWGSFERVPYSETTSSGCLSIVIDSCLTVISLSPPYSKKRLIDDRLKSCSRRKTFSLGLNVNSALFHTFCFMGFSSIDHLFVARYRCASFQSTVNIRKKAF